MLWLPMLIVWFIDSMGSIKDAVSKTFVEANRGNSRQIPASVL